MAHTYANLLTHAIFSTKGREPVITPGLKPDLPAYLGGIVRELGGKVVAANSMPDHVHMLLWLPADTAVADALRVVKTNSSRWVRRSRSGHRGFAWQTGYAAFSVSQSSATAVANTFASRRSITGGFRFRRNSSPFSRRTALITTSGTSGNDFFRPSGTGPVSDGLPVVPWLTPWAKVLRPLRGLHGA